MDNMENSDKRGPVFLDKQQVAKKLSVSVSTVERYMREGILKVKKMNGSKKARCWFREDDINTFLESL
jgi:predicted site-specific integrase-resolvase